MAQSREAKLKEFKKMLAEVVEEFSWGRSSANTRWEEFNWWLTQEADKK